MVDLRYIDLFFLLIIIKGIFKTYNQMRTFLVILEHFLYQHFTESIVGPDFSGIIFLTCLGKNRILFFTVVNCDIYD